MTTIEKKSTKKGGGAPKSPAQPSPPGAKAAGAGLSLRSPAASPEAERRPTTDIMEEIRLQKPEASQPVSCGLCHWRGVIGDCEERDLGGDQVTGGWSWICPRCKATVEVYAWRQLV